MQCAELFGDLEGLRAHAPQLMVIEALDLLAPAKLLPLVVEDPQLIGLRLRGEHATLHRHVKQLGDDHGAVHAELVLARARAGRGGRHLFWLAQRDAGHGLKALRGPRVHGIRAEAGQGLGVEAGAAILLEAAVVRGEGPLTWPCRGGQARKGARAT